eukprot:gene14672-21837_t
MRAVSIVAFGLGLMAIAASFVPILYSDKSMAELVAAVRWRVLLIPLLVPLLVTGLLMFFDPAMSGIALSKGAQKKLTFKRRLDLAVQRTWELSKQGPVFKALAWCIRKGYGAYATLLRKTMGAKKLDGEPNTPTFVKLVQNDQNGVAVGWEVEPSSQAGNARMTDQCIS